MTEPVKISTLWVWFDLDDTIWDFSGNSIITLAEVYDIAHLDRWWKTVDEWRDHYHAINADLWVKYAHAQIDRDTLRESRFAIPLKDMGVDTETATIMAWKLDNLYLSRLGQKQQLIPEARRTLQRLRNRGHKIGILSNGFKDVQYNKLNSSGIAPLIDCVTLSDEIDINKPDTRLYDYAAEKAGTTAKDSTLVGDNPDTDIIGAINAGWQAIWYNPKKLPASSDLVSLTADNSTLTFKTIYRLSQIE